MFSSKANITYIDLNPFGQDDPNKNLEVPLFPALDFFLFIFTDIVLILTIYLVRKNDTLRTWEHKIILNWAVCCLVYTTFETPLIRRAFYKAQSYLFKNSCYGQLIQFLFIFLASLLAFLLFLNWTLRCYEYRNVQRVSHLSVVYALGFITYVVLVILCLYELDRGLQFGVYLMEIIMLAVAILNLLKYRKMSSDPVVFNTRYSTVVSNIIIFSWTPVISQFVYVRHVYSGSTFDIFLLNTAATFNIVTFFNPLVVFFYLCRTNEPFHDCVLSLLGGYRTRESDGALLPLT